jgi:hypothetical protein
MSISGVSSTSGLSQTDSQSSVNQLRQTFKQLASSLQSGDLAGAQQAFTSLEKLLQSNQSASQNSTVQPASTPQSPVQSDLAALGQALSSGDLSAAQGDFSKLQKICSRQAKAARQARASDLLVVMAITIGPKPAIRTPAPPQPPRLPRPRLQPAKTPPAGPLASTPEYEYRDSSKLRCRRPAANFFQRRVAVALIGALFVGRTVGAAGRIARRYRSIKRSGIAVAGSE